VRGLRRNVLAQQPPRERPALAAAGAREISERREEQTLIGRDPRELEPENWNALLLKAIDPRKGIGHRDPLFGPLAHADASVAALPWARVQGLPVSSVTNAAMRAPRLAGLCILIVAVAAGPVRASLAQDALIRPGVGIGKIRMEMRLAAVRRVLGKPAAVAERRRLGFGNEYVEYTWGVSPNWRVGVIGRPGEQLVIMVATTSS